MKRFEENQQLQKVILGALEREPLRREILLRRVYGSGGSISKFTAAFDWLRKKGYVAKNSGKRTAPYALSAKGKQYLAGLRAGD